MREAVQRKLQNSEEARMEIEQKRDTLKSQLIALEKDHERLLKIHEQNKKQVDELARERDILNKNFLKVCLTYTLIRAVKMLCQKHLLQFWWKSFFEVSRWDTFLDFWLTFEVWKKLSRKSKKVFSTLNFRQEVKKIGLNFH